MEPKYFKGRKLRIEGPHIIWNLECKSKKSKIGIRVVPRLQCSQQKSPQSCTAVDNISQTKQLATIWRSNIHLIANGSIVNNN